MEFDFDPAKDEANRFKHGLKLSFGQGIFDDPFHRILPSFREQDGEERYKAVGRVNGKLHTAVFVLRDDRIRLISVRRSNASEQRDYDRHSGRSG
ncbi:MAG: BrnT family toxin [Novosphingobium sp.]